MKERLVQLTVWVIIGCSMLDCNGQQPSVPDTLPVTGVGADTTSLPKALGFVSDYGAIYTVSQREVLDSLLQDFEDSTSAQLALFTFTKEMLKDVQIDDYLLNIANSWKVGVKGKNNGILVGICAECRSMRIENGFGIERILSSNETKKIIETAFFPDFKNEEYYRGTINGLTTLIRLLRQRINTNN